MGSVPGCRAKILQALQHGPSQKKPGWDNVVSAAPLIKGGSFGEDLTPRSFLAGVGVELGLEESGLNRPGGVFAVYPSDRG